MHFAADHLGMESLEARLTRAYEVGTMAELDALVTDLPRISDEKILSGSFPTLAPLHAVPERGVVMAVLGGVSRKGSWVVPRNLKVIAILGGAEIDLRDGKFAPGVSTIDVTAIMGGVEITVPPGVRVETMGAAFMGGFEASAGDANALDPHAPILRVTGTVIMAGCEVRVRKPGKRMLARFQEAISTAGLLEGG